MIELVSRKRDQNPPPWAVWEALAEPNRDPTRPWLKLHSGEVPPRIVEADKPALVVWSSLWPDRTIKSASTWNLRALAVHCAGRF